MSFISMAFWKIFLDILLEINALVDKNSLTDMDKSIEMKTLLTMNCEEQLVYKFFL